MSVRPRRSVSWAWWGVVVVLVALPATIFGRTIEVPGDADTIRRAIDVSNASTDSSDTIRVSSGTYIGNLPISLPPGLTSKTLTIQANNGARVIVQGATSDPLIQINAGTVVTIRGLILITTGIAVRVNSAAATLRNLVIESASRGIECNNMTSGTIEQITFYQGTDGIACANSLATIRNNIFSNLVGVPISLTPTPQGQNVPSNNLFFPGQQFPGEIGNDPVLGEDPLFVDVADHDFHLRDLSAAKDEGVGSDRDESAADIGAYGGSTAHSVPFPPPKPTADCDALDPATCTVTWSQNLDYAVSGYLVLSSGPAAPDSDYDVTTAVDNPTCTGSPPQCSAPVGSLMGFDTDPAQVAAPTTGFGDSQVRLSWPAVTNATAYEVHKGTTSGSLALDQIVSGTEATVSNLVNGTLYFFAVRAVSQPMFHAVVKSAYENPVTTSSAASEASEAADEEPYGAARLGPFSAEVSETPQPVVEFPPLEDLDGCFIATAAYGSSLAPQVDVLRMFRERYLRPHWFGRSFIRVYETWSPPLADVIRSSDALRLMVRVMLWPMVALTWIAVYAPWWGVAIAGAVAIVIWATRITRRGALRA